MEKEKILQALRESVKVNAVDGGVMMSVVFDKQADSILELIKPLLEADRIVRELTNINVVGRELFYLKDQARTYVKNQEGWNPSAYSQHSP